MLNYAQIMFLTGQFEISTELAFPNPNNLWLISLN